MIGNRGKQKTFLFSSHILEEVEAICYRVIIINKGKLVADDRLSQLQKENSGNMVKIRFKETVAMEDLENLGAVKTVHQMDGFEWSIETDQAAELKKQLLELALQNNLNIVSLQSVSGKLEDVFRRLTQTD